MIRGAHARCRPGYAACALSLLLLSCAANRPFTPAPPIPDDRQPSPEPAAQKINIVADIITRQFSDQLEQSLDLSRQLRNVSGHRKQALNVDSFGEVPNSSWFTNRNGRRRLSLAEIERGPDTGTGPSFAGPWTIVRAKTEGVTPGFHVLDSRGDRYVLKFDPRGYAELSTGAEIVGTKLFYAAGYNVPENYLVIFAPERLSIGKKVKITARDGVTKLMNQEDLQAILNRIEKRKDGRIRAVASRYISGKLKGPFSYKGYRADDPNDFIPHQHRRELRGLRVIAAWLNHFDTKANNTLDVYDPAGYMKHYLIDFGSTLGSQGDEPMPPEIGHEESFDMHEMLKAALTLGLHVRQWEKVRGIHYRSIGHFQSADFQPQKYKFILANPAFELMTDQDGYWGAKIVASFTDEQIRAAVAAADYSNPEAAEYLVRTIIERRDIISRYWFAKMNPVDRFEIRTGENGEQALVFADLAIEAGVAEAAGTRYRVQLRHSGRVLARRELETGRRRVVLPEAGKSGATARNRFLEVEIRTRRRAGKWSKWVRIYLEPDSDSGGWRLAGLRRQG